MKVFNYEPLLTVDDRESVISCIESGIASSSHILSFEKALASYFNSEVVCCSSGTSALHIALLSLGVGPGHEVICPALSFSATWNSIIYTGASPIFCDVDPLTWCIDESKINDLITEKTKAIMSVDLYGNLCNYDKIKEICKENNLYLICDSAESLGSLYRNKPAASYGDISCISFNINKIITCNGGGAIIVNNKLIDAASARRLINQNKKDGPDYEYHGVGYNYRMSSFSAALGYSQFLRFREILEKKKLIHKLYFDNLKNDVKFQKKQTNSDLNYWMSVIQLGNKATRERVHDLLRKELVETKYIFSPAIKTDNSFRLYETCLSLPSGLNLKEAQINKICNLVKAAL